MDWARFVVGGGAQFALGAEIDFSFAGFLPVAGQEFEFLTTTPGGLSVAPSDMNLHLGVLTSSASGVVDFEYEIKSTSTSLILVALTDAHAVPEPGGIYVVGLGCGMLLRRRAKM